MLCHKCGKEITDDNKFCIYCGATVEEESNIEKVKREMNTDRKEEVSSTSGKKSKRIKVIIGILCVCLVAIGLFKKPISSFTYTKLAESKVESDFDAALKWALKAYKLDKDNDIVEKIYAKEGTNIIETNPMGAIEYLKKANEYADNNPYNSLISKAYTKEAQEKMEYEPDDALKLVEKAMEYDKSKESVNLYAKICIAKAKQCEIENVDEAIEYAKIAFKYDKSKEVKEKLIDLHLIKARRMYDMDLEGAIEVAKEAKLYGENQRIDEFLSKANETLEKIHIGKTVETNVVKNNEYIIYDSSYRRLNSSDLRGMNKSMLRLARNEIFARHGYVFKSPELRVFFGSKSWYEEDYGYNGYLNSVEQYNVEFIKSKENR